MRMFKFNLQLFGEGGGSGATAGAGTATSSDGSGADAATNTSDLAASQEGDLSDIVYGKSDETISKSQTEDNTTESVTPEDKTKTFENMIKKGGEYAEEFNNYTQRIIDKRFKETKNLESRMSKIDPILDTLSTKYGVDISDIDGLAAAIAEDDSLYEEAAFKEGLTTKQYREKVALERENKQLREAEETARRQQHSEEIFKGWLDEGEQLKAKYGLNNFDLRTEAQNPEFAHLLQSGVGLEAAYKAIHFDDMVGGAMAQTAANVEQALTNKIASRQSRPSENGTQSSRGTNFKPSVDEWNDNDINEVIRRVHRGDKIRL